MNRVVINGQVFETEGNISVVNGRVVVGGKTLTELKETTIRIEVVGDLISLTTDSSVSVNGNVRGNVDAHGSIQIDGSVGGNVKAGGSVQCGNVGGNMGAGGSIICNNSRRA